MRRIKIFDTTLRDGEQSPGIALQPHEKAEIARSLESLGVDVIEAGFAASSPGDHEGVAAVAGAVSTATVASLCRTTQATSTRAPSALRGAERSRLHIFIATSPLHMREKLGLEPEQVLEQTQLGDLVCPRPCGRGGVLLPRTRRARSPTSSRGRAAPRSRPAPTSINLPDTVGYALPDEYAAPRGGAAPLPRARRVELSVHCHDDLGLAVANSLAGLAAGATQVECTINGIGERAGNAALEEIVDGAARPRRVLRAETRHRHRGICTHVAARRRALTGYVVQPNKAVVGANAFAHEAGIHQDGDAQGRRDVPDHRPGRARAAMTLPLGKHSGRHAFARACTDAGLELDRDAARRRVRALQAARRRRRPRLPVRRVPGGGGMNMNTPQTDRVPRRRRRRAGADGRSGARAPASRRAALASRSTKLHVPFAGEAMTRFGHPLPLSTRARVPRGRRDPRRQPERAGARGADGGPRPRAGASSRVHLGPAGEVAVFGAVGLRVADARPSSARSSALRRTHGRLTAVGSSPAWRRVVDAEHTRWGGMLVEHRTVGRGARPAASVAVRSRRDRHRGRALRSRSPTLPPISEARRRASPTRGSRSKGPGCSCRRAAGAGGSRRLRRRRPERNAADRRRSCSRRGSHRRSAARTLERAVAAARPDAAVGHALRHGRRARAAARGRGRTSRCSRRSGRHDADARLRRDPALARGTRASTSCSGSRAARSCRPTTRSPAARPSATCSPATSRAPATWPRATRARRATSASRSRRPGPGATNLVTPIADAWMDSTPLVCITGQVRSNLIGTDAFQETDATGITMPIVKHSWLVQDVRGAAAGDQGRVPRRAHRAGRARCSSTSRRTRRRPSSTSRIPTTSTCRAGSRRRRVHERAGARGGEGDRRGRAADRLRGRRRAQRRRVRRAASRSSRRRGCRRS